MGVTAVIGLQWGDEGKGKVVDALGERADVVVRCQGGANAGHTIRIGEEQFILHLVPSGILREEVFCLIGSGVVVDLEVLDQELKHLTEAGIKALGRLTLSRRAHLVLPVHKEVELVQEKLRGHERLDTTRRGIGPCYSDKVARLGIRVGDVLEPSTLSSKIKILRASYREARYGQVDAAIERDLEYCERYRAMVAEIAGDTSAALRKHIVKGHRVLLEGSQGFLLDIDHGTYPFVTSCNTGIQGLANGAGLAPTDIKAVVGVVKAYMTRVGRGLLPTQMEEPYQTQVRERGKEYGATTGRPRRCGWLDLTAIRYSCSLNGVTSIAVTKLDTLAGLDTVKVCVAYDYCGNCVDTFTPELGFLEACSPRYVTNTSWGDLGTVSSVEDLPAGAAQYVDRILEAGGCGLELVSVGPGRHQILHVER